MKRSMIAVILLAVILLGGCTSAAFKESMKNGDSAMEEDRYGDAVTAYKAAVEEKPSDENAQSKLEEAEKLEEARKSVDEYLSTIRDLYVTIMDLSGQWDELRQGSADGDIDDFQAYDILNSEIIPQSTELMDSVATVMPPTEESQQAHEAFVSAIDYQHQAFTEFLAALETGDMSKVTSANELLSSARKSEREFVYKIKPLMDEYGISFE